MVQKISHRQVRQLVENRGRKVRTAAYYRVSTQQELQENSFQLQMETYRRKIQEDPDLELVGIYGDLGRSGTQMKGREAFQQMMQACREGKIDLIYVKSISRFGRNMADVVSSIRELKRLHVRVIFEREGLDTADQQTELILGIMATIAEEESRSLSENLSWGRIERLKKGTPYGVVTYGYRETKDHTWIVCQEEAERVKKAFSMALDRHNYCEIRMELQSMEDRDHTGRIWNQSTLHYMLVNPYYTGVYISNKTIETVGDHGKVRKDNSGERGQFVIEGHHEALVSRADFETVKGLMQTRALYTPRNWRKLNGERTDQNITEID